MKTPSKYKLVIVSDGTRTAILYNGKTHAKNVESCSFTADGPDVGFSFTQKHIAGMEKEFEDPAVFIDCANQILGEEEQKQILSKIPTISQFFRA